MLDKRGPLRYNGGNNMIFGGIIMNLLRYYEAKEQNRKTAGYFRELEKNGKAKELPGAIGKHYRDVDGHDYVTTLSGWKDYVDKYPMKLLTCSNSIQADLHIKSGEVRVTGAHRCNEPKYCAVCGTREARRVASQLSYQFLRLKDKNYKYFMLTLTLPNNHNGFKEEFAVMDGVSRDLMSFCGYDSRFDTVCKGVFGAHELTWSKEKGWHPHIHFILAYDPSYIRELKLNRKGKVYHMSFNRLRPDLSQEAIIQRYVKLIRERFPSYYCSAHIFDRYNDRLNVDFQPITNTDDTCSELCKYFIDFNCFRDSDTFFTYLCDIHGLRKYIKRGCFGWNEDIEEEWLEWCKEGKPDTLNLHFMEFAPLFDRLDFSFFGLRPALIDGKVCDVPLYLPSSEVTSINLEWNSVYKEFSCYYWDFIKKKICYVRFNESTLKSLYKVPSVSIGNLYKMLINDKIKSPNFIKSFDIDNSEEGG